MRKKHALFIIFGLALMTIGFVSQAATNTGFSNSKGFGGKIINTKAARISELEGAGYSCNVSGTTIEINPVTLRGGTKIPSSYAIPSGTNNRTGFSLHTNQWILGKYSGQTTVTCILEGEPPLEEIVTLNTISVYGTSK